MSISIHAGAQNQDTYLAEIVSKSGKHQFAKLVDVYPSDESRIDLRVLKSLPLLKMKVVKKNFCDVKANQIFFSNQSSFFDEEIKGEVARDSSTVLPCYQIVRKSIRIIEKGSLQASR
ncbi:hypothetical protein [Edaphobacter modestus]|uniref:Uncharacterized protein n=1 Tax=Edaphobacter modestus TaxID=388466 RepID=A0A4Q7XZM8_9BACT|nr:hypothetical protein [Edaphobacter modestus]RZU29013.1 hypothetical protein BDD14_6601 [Edaphobacter modestus]